MSTFAMQIQIQLAKNQPTGDPRVTKNKNIQTKKTKIGSPLYNHC